MSARNSYHVKNEAINHGKDYELLVLACISLKLILNTEVKDFRLWSNEENCKYGKFDDILVEVHFASGKTSLWFLQVKHCKSGKKNELSCFRMKNKNIFFNPNYFGDPLKLPLEENFHYVLYTNNKFTQPTSSMPCMDFTLSAKSIDKDDYLWLLNTRNDHDFVYKFEGDIPGENFFNQFYLFSHQQDSIHLKNYINSFLKEFLHDENCFDAYLLFLDHWSQNINREKLSQTILTSKLVACMVSPFTPKFSLSERRKDYYSLLVEAFLKFDITMIANIDENIINKVCSIITEEESNLLVLVVSDLKSYEIVQSALSLCKQNGLTYKFILLSKFQFSGNNWTVFKNLKNLKQYDSIFCKVKEKMYISIQGKRFFKLEKLLDREQYHLLDVEDILNLIHGQTIGELIERDHNYIEREISRNLVSYKLLHDKNFFTSFLIVLKLRPHDLLDVRKNIKNSDLVQIKNFDINNPRTIIYMDDHDNLENELKKLIVKNKIKNVLWLKYFDSEYLEVVDGFGEFNLLKKFSNSKTLFLDENEYIDQTTSRLNILCADPGMGKSTFLKNLQTKVPPEFFCIKISLRTHSHFFDVKRSFEEIIEYFGVDSKIDLPLCKKIFGMLIIKQKIVILWDGVNEVAETNLDNVLSAILELRDKEYIQYVTSRNYLKKDLEIKFQTLTRTINGFDSFRQELYISRKVPEMQKSKLQGVLKKVPNDFLTIPLQLAMLIDLFCNTNTNETLPKIITETDFYKYFVDQKINIYYNGFTESIILLKQNKEHLLEKFETVALKLFFYEELYKKLVTNSYCEMFLKNITCGWNKTGIIKNVETSINGFIPDFTHISYGEYFTASFIAKNFEKLPDLKSYIFEQKFQNIRYMFDLIIAENFPIHLKILQKNFAGLNSSEPTESIDAGGRTPLHLLCSWGENHGILPIRYDDTMSQAEIDTQSYVETLQNLLKTYSPEIKDSVFHMNAFDYARLSGSQIASQVLSQHKFL